MLTLNFLWRIFHCSKNASFLHVLISLKSKQCPFWTFNRTLKLFIFPLPLPSRTSCHPFLKLSWSIKIWGWLSQPLPLVAVTLSCICRTLHCVCTASPSTQSASRPVKGDPFPTQKLQDLLPRTFKDFPNVLFYPFTFILFLLSCTPKRKRKSGRRENLFSIWHFCSC